MNGIEKRIGRQIGTAIGIDRRNPANRTWCDTGLERVMGKVVRGFSGFVEHGGPLLAKCRLVFANLVAKTRWAYHGRQARSCVRKTDELDKIAN